MNLFLRTSRSFCILYLIYALTSKLTIFIINFFNIEKLRVIKHLLVQLNVVIRQIIFLERNGYQPTIDYIYSIIIGF